MKKALLFAALVATGCPSGGGAKFPQPAGTMTADSLLAKLREQDASRSSFTGESVMDYWVGEQRLKGTVMVMGTSQRQVRFNALSPQGGGVLADMACDGADFTYVDFQNNCYRTGPCTGQSIATLLRVTLEPDDFRSLATGGAPLPASATGDVTWDGNTGAWNAKLAVPGGTQTIVVDARDGAFHVTASELTGPDGKSVWKVEHTDLGEDHLPAKTRFQTAGEGADLIVEWKQRVLNPQIAPAKFSVTVPAGLPTCP